MDVQDIQVDICKTLYIKWLQDLQVLNLPKKKYHINKIHTTTAALASWFPGSNSRIFLKSTKDSSKEFVSSWSLALLKIAFK